MSKEFANTNQHKEAVITDVIDKLAAVMVIDSDPEEIDIAVSDALLIIRQYPDFEQIKTYPLGRILADHKAIDIERNLCLCLSGEAPQGTLDIVMVQLNHALTNLQSFLQ